MVDFDLTAAGIRADAAEHGQTLELVARKFEIALPDQCVVRRGGLRRRVNAVELHLGEERFSLLRSGIDVVAERETAIHDMRRERLALPLGEWLAALEAALQREAERSADVRAALDRLVWS